MSRIWAPLPLLELFDQPPAPEGVCWWRRILPPNDRGDHLHVYSYPDRGGDEARLGCWEWFDGLDVQLVHGHDVIDVGFAQEGRVTYLDVLALPLPLFGLDPHWQNVTAPDDRDQRYPYRGPRLGMSGAALPALPFPYAPHVRGDIGFPG